MIVVGGADDPLLTHRREITVVFLDLRGFTTFAETAEPEEVMQILRQYHRAMGELALKGFQRPVRPNGIVRIKR